MSRRWLLGAGTAGALGAAGVFGLPRLLDDGLSGSPVLPGAGSVQATETARERAASGQVVRRTLSARATEVDLGGRVVPTWTYGGELPGPEIRLTAGDRLQVALTNGLPDETTVHWHGLALRNDMDGVPGLTQQAVAAGASFDYDFVVPHPGTYWFHPHVGTQLDTGLYAPLIVEDPDEQGRYTDEVVLVLDDWTDGWGDSPADLLARLAAEGMSGMGGMGDMGGMGGMDGMGSHMADMAGVSPDTPLGRDGGDVVYPANLVNGRLPSDPFVVPAKRGDRLRLRLINASGDTAFRFAVAGHVLRVTHTDGFPVRPVEVDTLVIGMGERYDVEIEVQDGSFPIVARPESKEGPSAAALLTTAPGSRRMPLSSRELARVTELGGRLLRLDDLAATEAVALERRTPDRELSMSLEMGDGGREWLINGRTYEDREPLELRQGERVRLEMVNNTMMFHPMHLHGHTPVIGEGGPRKDTVNVVPGQRLSLDFDADNPGQWLTHCHNLYHGELGMMTVVSYVA
ncbi:multicopper oxidase family protein [Nocardioides dokdonensis]|uniref:multicopper oxidase family protein n=1 Tax=Nocardioides dokdonensis TaxID=450734 RepID=UPI001C54C774|nr:multicopper oxidase family protein [Nocardioides dokdonensis]